MMIKVTTLKPTPNAMIRCCLFNPALLFLIWSVCGVGDDDDIPHFFPWSRMIRYARRGRSKGGDGHLPFEKKREREKKRRKGEGNERFKRWTKPSSRSGGVRIEWQLHPPAALTLVGWSGQLDGVWNKTLCILSWIYSLRTLWLQVLAPFYMSTSSGMIWHDWQERFPDVAIHTPLTMI